MAKFKIHLIGSAAPITIDAKFDTPEALFSSAAAAGFVIGVSRRTTSNSVVSQASVLVSFPAIAMVEGEQ